MRRSWDGQTGGGRAAVLEAGIMMCTAVFSRVVLARLSEYLASNRQLTDTASTLHSRERGGGQDIKIGEENTDTHTY